MNPHNITNILAQGGSRSLIDPFQVAVKLFPQANTGVPAGSAGATTAFRLTPAGLSMDGLTALTDHGETGLFNGIIPGLNGIGLGVQVTMTPQHAAALMHHLSSAGSAMPLGPSAAAAANNFIKFTTKNIGLPAREPVQPTATITQINGGNPTALITGSSSSSSTTSSSSSSSASQQSQTGGGGVLVPVENGLMTVASNTVGGVGGGGGDSSSGRSTPNNNDTTTAGKLFVGGLSWNTSSEKLRQYFSMFGNVTDVLIMRDPVTQRSRGFGFITFSDVETVDKVLKVPIHTLDGKKIDPKHATPKNKPRNVNKTKKIFVGGVSQDTTGDEVKAYFSQFGIVDDAVMLMDQQTKRHRGFGFVTFDDEEVVDHICEIHFHTIKNKKVECKKAQPKELIQPNLLLAGKRMILGPLGVRVAPQSSPATAAVSPVSQQLAALQAQHHQSQVSLAALASHQNAAAAAAAYGKLLGAYPSLSGYRYSPYPMATIAPSAAAASFSAAAAAAAAAAQGGTAGNATNGGAPTTTYPTASLANVDMSSFQGIDWAAMYGMGMYV